MRYRLVSGRCVPSALTALLLMALAGQVGAAAHQHAAPVVLAPGYGDLAFTPPGPGTYRLPPLGHAADGPVVDSNGMTYRLHDLMGDKIVLLSFIYTTCSDINGCPLASFVLKGVQDRVRELPKLHGQVRLLSFSFDPEHDTPEVLHAYSEHFKAAGFDWRFVSTPSRSELEPILAAYDQWVVRDYDAQGNYQGTMSHLLRVFLIDRDRRIRNIYSTSFLHADTVANDIETLIREEF